MDYVILSTLIYMKLNKKTTVLLKIILSGIIIIILFTTIFYFFDYSHFNGITEDSDKSITDRIFNRFYFTTGTLSSASYGDITPNTTEIKILSLILQLILIVSLISSLPIYG